MFKIANDPLWLKGPSFLCDRPIDDNPPLEEATLKECASELKMNDRLQFEEVHSLLVTSEIETVINCETFSSLKKLLRTTVYVLKIVQILNGKTRRMQGTINTEMNSNDLNIAELYWIKACQRALVRDTKFEQWKVQIGLHLDDAGLWRCKGRLGCADLPEDAKHPMLLPGGHYFTT